VGRINEMLAFDDAAIARIFIAASRLPLDADRIALLEDFARRAEAVPRSGLLGAPSRAPGRRPRLPARSRAAEKQRRYRARLRRGVAYVPLPVTRLIVDYLVRGGLLPRDHEAADRVEIGLAAAAALERAARADRQTPCYA
jgi:hypothetical protein